MQKSPVLGIIYAKFDEKIGPKPSLWYPSTIDEQIRNLIASESMSLSFSRNEIPRSLAIIPISKLGLKAYVKFGEYHDSERRGHICDITLCLAFKEENDSIFYKYYEDFQHLFDEFSRKLIKAEEEQRNTEHLQNIVAELFDLSVAMVKTLEAAEMAPRETAAFPSTDEESKTKKETLRFKIIVCGDPAVGKTSIVLRFTDKAFKRTYMPTLGTNISDKTVEYDDFKINFQIWDVAGQIKFQRFRNSFYSGASGYLLVFDLTQPETLKNLYAWSNDIKSIIGETTGFIIGNKCDLADQRRVDEDMINQISNDLGLRVVLTSAFTGENIEEAFRTFGLEIVEKSDINKTDP